VILSPIISGYKWKIVMVLCKKKLCVVDKVYAIRQHISAPTLMHF
jgi:hypothetical protein